MRKTNQGERRSGALSVDLMELNENDRQIRQTTATRQLQAVNVFLLHSTVTVVYVLYPNPNMSSNATIMTDLFFYK